MQHDDPYREPALYDLEYADYADDIGFYCSLASRAGGPVLELGCGTGRLTLPMARQGVSVTGIDAAQPMLDGLADKLKSEHAAVAGRVRSALGDFTTLDLGETFPLVLLPFNALHHCKGLDQLCAVFEVAAKHLAPGGRFALDCYLPDLALYDRDPALKVEPRTFIDPRDGKRLESWEQGWWKPEERVHHVVYTYAHPDGTEERMHLQLRMFWPEELREAFARTGWRVILQAQDFEGTAVTQRSLKWVLVLERA